MSWPEFLSQMLEATHKVDKAAVFNTKGQPLATTQGLQVTERDGRAILLSMHDPSHALTRIMLDDTDFLCFQGNGHALMGTGSKKSQRVLVARLTDDALIVVMGNPSGHGSFLHELQHNLAQRTRRQTAPQSATSGAGEANRIRPPQQKQQKPVIHPVQTQSAVVNGEKMLLQLDD